MPPRDREDALLAFLQSHGFPMTPKTIYRGMKIEQGITFAYRTVQDMLSRLEKQGYVMRCDKEALDEGRIEPIPEDASARRAPYFITEAGRERLEESE